MQRVKRKLVPNPEANASFLSRITYVYMLPFFWRGFHKQLEEEDLCEPLENHRSEIATERLTKEWEREKRLASEAGRKPSLAAAVRRIYFRPVALLGILLFFEEVVKLLQPLAMGRLIRYFRYDAPLTLTEAYLAAGGVAVTSAMVAFIHHPYFYGLQKQGMELKVAACGMIMQKGLRLSSAALHKTTVGHIVTLMSNDVAKFDMSFLFVHFLWLSPLILISYTYMLWQEIGVSSLAGFGALVILVPIQGYFSRMMGKCRRQIASRTDKRVSVMNEILNGIRVIKMYAWEDAFAKVVDDLRKNELVKVKANSIWQSLVMGTFWASGKMIILFAITCFILTGNQLTAERIFVAMALYNACRLPVTLFVPFALQFLFESNVSLRRVQAFLELEEYEQLERSSTVQNGHILSKYADGLDSDEKTPLKTNDMGMSLQEATQDEGEAYVELKNFTAVWEAVESDDSSEAAVAVKNISLSARPGQLIAVVGPVGCGKSSLLSSILRETRRVSGSMVVNGHLAYASQDAWIFSGSIRDNILFGEPYDEKRYQEAIRVCALNKDLSQLPNGDRTLVGDRGHALSGGQKARVSLARAVYRNSDIYLLDDPLSAVDSAVGRYLFDKCIMGFLKLKVTILVTHQVQYLRNADQILLMRGGEVIASGTINQLKHLSTFADILQETAETYSRRASETESLTPHSPQKVVCEMEEIFEDDDDTLIPTSEVKSVYMCFVKKMSRYGILV
uniref:Uncharacterized protein n=2 Tax=Parascaris univalens TaxID=6257 RepID=A0A914ZNC1_PARUN